MTTTATIVGAGVDTTEEPTGITAGIDTIGTAPVATATGIVTAIIATAATEIIAGIETVDAVTDSYAPRGPSMGLGRV
jgi:hypothetical protein